jgi:hypothetical protein
MIGRKKASLLGNRSVKKHSLDSNMVEKILDMPELGH